MKRPTTLVLLAMLTVLIVPESRAQSLIANYFRCNTAYETEADFIVNTVFANIYNRHAEAGHITGWGWNQHTAGGPWRRISTITAPDRTTAMNMWGQIVTEIQAEHPEANRRFNEICDSHDDYIWSQTASSSGVNPAQNPTAWVSTYWVCNEAKESRADELMMQMTPVFDKHMSAGHLTGWTYFTHEIGGRFRRLLTVSGEDINQALDGRDMVIAELQAEHGDVFGEFASICSGHVDYLWANARAGE